MFGKREANERFMEAVAEVASLEARVAAHEATITALDGHIIEQRADRDKLWEHIEAKDKTLREMQREGFLSPAQQESLPRTEEKALSSDVVDAIDRVAEPGTQLHADMEENARGQLAELSESEVIDEIETGDTVNAFSFQR